MSAILFDEELRAKLNGLNQQLEICDEAGHTVGRFVPEGLYRQLLASWVRAQFGDAAEREQALQEVRLDGGLTTAEAITGLEQVTRESRSAS